MNSPPSNSVKSRLAAKLNDGKTWYKSHSERILALACIAIASSTIWKVGEAFSETPPQNTTTQAPTEDNGRSTGFTQKVALKIIEIITGKADE